MTIRHKITLAMALVIAFVLSSPLFTYLTARQQRNDLATVESAAENVVTNSLAMVRITKDIELDVVQVQQFLSDISATRGEGGLDDGFDEAAKFVAKFGTDVSDAEQIAKTAGRSDLLRILDEAKSAFASYYEVGQRMAHAYVDQGPAGGNKVMPEFDKQADAIGERLEQLRKLTEAASAQTATELRGTLREIRTDIDQQVLIILGLALGSILASAGCSLLLFGGVMRPLALIGASMRHLAEGDLNVEIAGTGRRDEIGAMAGSVQIFKDGMVESDRLRAERERLKQEAEAEKKAMLSRMADEFDHRVGGSLAAVSSASGEMRRTAQSMSATAEAAGTQATTVAAAAGQASTNVQTVAAATEQLSSSVVEIGRRVAESARIATGAVAEASQTNVTVQGLSAAAQKIGDVVKLISDIASQTNLLALNATIEAARAGDAGKGFAVVASEVKSLANQTARATEEISEQVTSMQTVTRQAVQAIQGIGATIGSMSEIATTIASAVEEQGAATQEISRNVQEAALGTGQVSSTIGEVRQAASETGTTATRVLAAAETLGQHAEALRTGIQKFVAEIRVG